MRFVNSASKTLCALHRRGTLYCASPSHHSGTWRLPFCTPWRPAPYDQLRACCSSPAAGPQPPPDGSAAGGGSAASRAITGASSGGSIMAGVALIADSDWDKLGQHLAAYDEQREAIIKRCRDAQKLSKQAVYSLHRGELDKAAQQLDKAEAIARELLPALITYPSLRVGSYSAAIEEYAEAMAFATFLREGRLIRSDELPLAEPDEFLGGVLDFTGELNRYSIARATVRDRAAVQGCRDLVDAIMGRFLQFDLRNGALRKKFDGLKYTLKKMESTLYELALTEAMGFKKTSEAVGMDPEAGGPGGGEEEQQ